MGRTHTFAGALMALALASVMVLAVVVMPGSGTAYAQPAVPDARALVQPVQPAPGEQRRVERYGLQVAFVDAAAVGVLGLAFVLQTRMRNDEAALGLAAAGLATWWVGAPVVHGLRGNRRGALTSLALRTLLPTAAGALAWKLSPATTRCPPGDRDCEPWPATIDRLLITAASALAGAATASLIDWIALSKKTHPRRASRQAGNAPRFTPLVTPLVDVRARSLSLGFRGSF